MSKRRDLQLKLGSLEEIRGIMGAMKNLAFMETRKLTKFLSTQQRAVASIEAVASDFASFYGHTLPKSEAATETCVLIGSERGFCGDFNETLAQEMSAYLEKTDVAPPVIAVGSRLEPKLRHHPSTVDLLQGASVVEEVEPVLTRLADLLIKAQRALGANAVLGVTAFYHSDETNGIRIRRLLPLPDTTPTAQRFSHPPLLNLSPEAFFSGLTEHYLYAALHEVIYSSLMVENRYRLEHMDNAIRQLDKRVNRLQLQYNTMRQEEITEEIEVIMLSVENLRDAPSQ